MPVLLESALRAAGRGWRVFPVQSRGKRPLVDHWQDDATTDPTQVRQWWRGRWAYANIGAIVPAGTLVVDVDRPRGGDSTLGDLEAQHGVLPPTLTAATGSGGQHLWFGVEDPDQLRQGADVLGEGIDTRVAGRGYVVIPPSIHPCGGRYEWTSGTRVIADAPAWIVEQLRKPPVQEFLSLPPAERSGHGSVSAYGRRALDDELDRLVGTPVGKRNHKLHLAAVRLGQLVGAGHLGEDEVVAALARAGRDLKLDDTEVTDTVASGVRWGRANPRGGT